MSNFTITVPPPSHRTTRQFGGVLEYYDFEAVRHAMLTALHEYTLALRSASPSTYLALMQQYEQEPPPVLRTIGDGHIPKMPKGYFD